VQTKIKVGIQAQIDSGAEGGLEQTIIGLVDGLRQVNDDKFHYYIIVDNASDTSWIESFMGTNQTIVRIPIIKVDKFDGLKNKLGVFRKYLGIYKRMLIRFFQYEKKDILIPISNGVYEKIGIDVLHIIYPLHYVQSEVPTIITMHDLQHRHLRYIFDKTPQHLKWRETTYPVAFAKTKKTIAICNWVKKDIIEQYQVDEEKIEVIHWGAPTSVYDTNISKKYLESIADKYLLPKAFLLYPAVTYEHKNHVRLIQAVELAQQLGVDIHIVCTGAKKHFWPTVEATLSYSTTFQNFKFLGFIPKEELKALYFLSQFVILPTLFEGAGLPLLEAFHEGKPVICSDIPAFREYGEQAPLYFDPYRFEDIANKIIDLINDIKKQTEMIEEGYKQIQKFSWKQTATLHNKVYKTIFENSALRG
jgi:glycosyltransferase involved in cell wall biosynthesis